MKRLLISVLMLSSYPLFAQEAEEEKHWIDVKMEQAIDKDGSTAGMITATDAALKDWDKELNKHYQKLLTNLDDKAKAKLRESQRAWIQFRDKEIALIQAFYSKIDGTMFRVISASAVMELTHKRAVSLSYMAEFAELREDSVD